MNAAPDRDLAAAAAAAIRCLGVRGDDDVLIVCNAPQRSIAASLAEAAQHDARTVELLEFRSLIRDGEEPPAFVAEAMLTATVILAPTTRSLSHTRARRAATARGARIATLPGITAEVFARAVAIDYGALRRAGAWVAAALTGASTCRVTSSAGTDLVIELRGREAISDDGDLRAEAAWGNLPAGEAFIAPLETSGRGTIVFDGALAGYGLLREPVAVSVVGGRAVDAAGEAAQWLLETLDAGGLNGRVLAELGIGTNAHARVTGNILEDEKALRTAHLAFGTSSSFGGANDATVHVDGIVLGPTVELDGRPLMREGEIRLPAPPTRSACRPGPSAAAGRPG